MALKWFDENNTILLWEFGDQGTLELVMDEFREYTRMVESVHHQVYSILNFSITGKMQPGIFMHMPEMVNLLPKDHHRTALVVVVTKSQIINSMLNIFSQLYKNNYAFTTSVDRAFELVYEHQAQHPPTH